MKLSELSRCLDMPERQVRYLIAEGIMPPATETGRYANGFNDEHLRLGREYKRLLDAGYGVKAIKARMTLGECSVYRDDRIEVNAVDADAFDGLDEAAARRIARDVGRALLARIKTRKE